MSDRVTCTLSCGVADVRLNRPEKINALDDTMFEALIATGERLKSEPGVRAVVLSGEGRGFCAGLDTAVFGRMAASPHAGDHLLTSRRTARGANHAQQAVMVWRELALPVIGAVHGVAFGGGLQLALGADLRFVAPDAKMSVLEILWGLIPDMGGVALLRSLVRDDVARELTYSGRMVCGEEALTLGLATRVCRDPRAEALAFASGIAGRSPSAIRAAKRLMNLAQHASEAEILLAESAEQAALIGSPDQREAIALALKSAPTA